MKAKLKVFFLAFTGLIVYGALCTGLGYIFSEPLYVQLVAFLVIIVVGGLYVRTVLYGAKKYEKVPDIFTSITMLVVVTFAVASIATTMWLLSFIQDKAFLAAEEAKNAYSNGLKVLMLVINFAVAPMAEEIIFRSFMYGQLATVNKLLALITSSVIFALYHGTIVHLYTGLIGGLILGCIYEKTHRLRYCVAAHSFFNITTAVAAAVPIPERLLSKQILFTIIVVVLNAVLGTAMYLLFTTDGAKPKEKERLKPQNP